MAGEEEKLNERLKAAGLWEEGLSLAEKQALCNLLTESCTYAINEEQRRQLLVNEKKENPSHDSKPCQKEQPEHDVQECSGSDRHQEVEEIGSCEEVTVAGASQSSNCDETDPPQKPVANHEPSATDLLQLSDDETSSGSVILPSRNIDVPSAAAKKIPHSPTSSIQNNKEELLHSLSGDEDVLTDPVVKESVESSQDLFDDSSHKKASSSLLGEEKNPVESEASYHRNLNLEQPKDTTAEAEKLKEAQHSGKIPVSTININDDKPADSLHPPISNSESSNATNDSKSKRPILDLSNQMPAQHIIERHSMRVNDIKFRSPAEFMSVDEETRVKIYKEILESLTKVSLALASSQRKPNVAVPWKKVIRQLPPKPTEDKALSSCSYSLRQRRGFKNRREIISDIFEEEMDELPEVEQVVKHKDSDWLPSLRTKKKRKGDATGQQNIPNSGIAQVECQSSDDESFVFIRGKRKLQRRNAKIPVVNGSVTSGHKENQSVLQNSVPSALPQLNIDKALLASPGKKYETGTQGKTTKYDSVIKMAELQAYLEDSSSDVDVVEVNEPTSKLSATMKSNLTSTGSKQQSLNNKIPVLSGTNISSVHTNAQFQRHEAGVDADKQRYSVVRNLSNTSSAFIKEKFKSLSPSGNGGGAETLSLSSSNDEVAVRPAPLKLRGEKRALVAGTTSPAPKVPCSSKNGFATSRCSEEQSPSSTHLGLPERNEGQPFSNLDNLSDHHKLVMEMAERRRILEEQKKTARSSKTKAASDEGPASFQCPLCQAYFSRFRIESHAAECDGVSPISTRQQRKPQQDHQKPSCSTTPARKTQQVEHTVTTIDSESEDHESERVTDAKAYLCANKPSDSASLPGYSAAVYAKGAGCARNSFNYTKGNIDVRQQLLVDSDDEEDDDDSLVPLDGTGRSATNSIGNNVLKRNK